MRKITILNKILTFLIFNIGATGINFAYGSVVYFKKKMLGVPGDSQCALRVKKLENIKNCAQKKVESWLKYKLRG